MNADLHCALIPGNMPDSRPLCQHLFYQLADDPARICKRAFKNDLKHRTIGYREGPPRGRIGPQDGTLRICEDGRRGIVLYHCRHVPEVVIAAPGQSVPQHQKPDRAKDQGRKNRPKQHPQVWIRNQHGRQERKRRQHNDGPRFRAEPPRSPVERTIGKVRERQ
ncbi:MAG: hypothetical protein R6V26_09080 [Roseovarius sp.]